MIPFVDPHATKTTTMAFFEGCTACAAGLPRSTNPYPYSDTSALHAYWIRGWNDELSRLPGALREARLARERPAAG